MKHTRSLRLLIAVGFHFALTKMLLAQGFVLPGVGPVNRSMGGAATAAPLDATGAIHWNPASITGLKKSQIDVGVDLVANQNKVSSKLFQGTPMQLSGSTNSDAGLAPLPALGVVYQPEDSDWSYGLGLIAIGGFAVNYPASTTNPVFTPPPPVGVGTSGGYSRLSLLQFVPTIARVFDNRLSIGFAPTITMADAQLSPFPFASPNDANGDGSFSYPGGVQSRPNWGVGLQAGIYYESESGLNLGFAVKSPQWFEKFKFNSRDELGQPQELSAEIEYPLIITGGASYKPTESTLLAIDVRWIDYESTPIFGESATFNADGSLNGLGWKSVILVASGLQWEISDRTTIRTGYSYNPTPIQDETAFVNTAAPAVYEHIFNLGFSHHLTEKVIISATWVHAFENSISGPILTPMAAVPLSSVAVRQAVDTAVLGVSFIF